MNYFALRFVQDIHLPWRKKINTIKLQIFGEEGAFPDSVLSKNEMGCSVYKIKVPRVSEKDPSSFIAKRKLFNPFKWIEFGLALIFEIPSWGIKQWYGFLNFKGLLIKENFRMEAIRTLISKCNKENKNLKISEIKNHLETMYTISASTENEFQKDIFPLLEDPTPENIENALDKLKKFSKPFEVARKFSLSSLSGLMLLTLLVNTIVSVVWDLPWAIARRFLAPSRYIIRPFLQYAQTDSIKWGIILGISLLMTAFIALAIFTGGGSLLPTLGILSSWMMSITNVNSAILSLVGLTSSIGKVFFEIFVVTSLGIAVNNCLQKMVMGFTDFLYATQRLLNFSRKETPVVQSTVFVAEFLHGINREIVDIKTMEEQNFSYKFALFTGTESLLYPKFNKGTLHPYGQFVFEEEATSTLSSELSLAPGPH